MKKGFSPNAVQAIQALTPILLSLLIVGVGRADIRERYQIVADVLVYSSAIATVIMIVSLVYPYTLEKPLLLALGGVRGAFANALDRRGFRKWCGMWRSYSELVLDHAAGQQQKWGALQEKYAEYRDWLIENQTLLPEEAVSHVAGHVIRQWGPWNLTQYEHRLTVGERLFPLYRHVDCDRQFREMVDPRHHITHTLISVWDGLSSYSTTRKWGRLTRLEEPHHPTNRNFLPGLPRV